MWKRMYLNVEGNASCILMWKGMYLDVEGNVFKCGREYILYFNVKELYLNIEENVYCIYNITIGDHIDCYEGKSMRI